MAAARIATGCWLALDEGAGEGDGFASHAASIERAKTHAIRIAASYALSVELLEAGAPL
jgi:hypothetical protein